jgi:hypothetical protein
MAINKDNSVKHNKTKYLKSYHFFQNKYHFCVKKIIQKIIKDKKNYLSFNKLWT